MAYFSHTFEIRPSLGITWEMSKTFTPFLLMNNLDDYLLFLVRRAHEAAQPPTLSSLWQGRTTILLFILYALYSVL